MSFYLYIFAFIVACAIETGSFYAYKKEFIISYMINSKNKPLDISLGIFIFIVLFFICVYGIDFILNLI